MKRTAMLSIVLGLGGLGAAAAETHTLTSADGSRTLEATILSYEPARGTAMIQANGRRMNVNVAAFQAADKTIFEDWFTATSAGRSLHVTIRDEEQVTAERVVDNGTVKSIDGRYVLNVRNNAGQGFEDIDVKYRLFYTKDGVDGNRNQSLTMDGEDEISAIGSRQDLTLSTTPAKLTNVKPLPASKCVGGT